nr:MAG TPA: hypothetical protein [Caudoviricetes sp.]
MTLKNLYMSFFKRNPIYRYPGRRFGSFLDFCIPLF